MNRTRKITLSAMVIAIYVIVMFLTQGFAFGEYQIRIATSLYSLSAIYPFLIIPMGIANFLSNAIMGGLGPLDMIGGILVGIITSGLVYLIKKIRLSDYFIALPILLCPGLIVPIWLSYLLHVPYKILAASLCVGQIVPAIAGVIIVITLRKVIKR